MAKEKISEPTHLDPDRFDTFLFNAADYLYRRKRFFYFLGVIFVLILSLSYGGFAWYQEIQEQKFKELFDIEEIVNQINKSSKEKLELAEERLSRFVSKYSGTKQEVIARYYLSILYKEAGKVERAIAELRLIVNLSDQKTIMRTMAHFYLANLYRDQNKYGEAVNLLERLKSEELEDLRMLELAETHLMFQEEKKGKQFLDILIKDFPKSELKFKANLLLESL